MEDGEEDAFLEVLSNDEKKMLGMRIGRGRAGEGGKQKEVAKKGPEAKKQRERRKKLRAAEKKKQKKRIAVFGPTGRPAPKKKGKKAGGLDSDADDMGDLDEQEQDLKDDNAKALEEGSAEADSAAARKGSDPNIDPKTGHKYKKKTKKTGATIDGGKSGKPLLCEIGKVLSEDEGKFSCIKVPKDKISCFKDADGDCKTCRDGLFLMNNVCNFCEEKCSKCNIEKCTECKDGYVLGNGRCRSCRFTELYDTSTQTCIARKNISGLKGKKSKRGKVSGRRQRRKKKFSVPKIDPIPKSANDTKDAKGKKVKLFAFAEYKIKTTTPPEAMVIRNQVNGGKNMKGTGVKPKKGKGAKGGKGGKGAAGGKGGSGAAGGKGGSGAAGGKGGSGGSGSGSGSAGGHGASSGGSGHGGKGKSKSINDDKEVDMKKGDKKSADSKDGSIKKDAKDIKNWPAKKQLKNFREKLLKAQKELNVAKKNQDVGKINLAKFELKNCNTLIVASKRKAINELEDAEDDYDNAKKKGDRKIEDAAKIEVDLKRKQFEECKRQHLLSLKQLDEAKVAPAKGDVEEDPKEARKAPKTAPKNKQQIAESTNKMVKARKELEALTKKGSEDELSEAQQNLVEAKERIENAEKNGNAKLVKRAKKKLLKAENALERDAKMSDSKSKTREAEYEMKKSQKKEKIKEVKETKKVFRDAKEAFENRKVAERQELAKIFLDDAKKTTAIIGELKKVGKEGELKSAKQKMKDAMKLTQNAYKLNFKSKFGDKRSVKVAIAKLEAVMKVLDSTKETKEDYKEDVNVYIDQIKNNDIVVKKKHELLKIAIRMAKGPLDAYKIPLRNWENSLKEVEIQQEKEELAKGDVDKALGELALMKKEDLGDARTVHKLSVDKDLAEAREKLTVSVGIVKKIQKKLVEMKQKIDQAKKVQGESQKAYDAAFAENKVTANELETAKTTKLLGDEKRKLLDAAKAKLKEAEKKTELAALKLKGDTNKHNDLNDKAKGIMEKLKKAVDFVREKEKKLKDVTKLVNNNVKKVNDIQHLIVKKLQFINDLKLKYQKRKDVTERARDKAREMEEIKEKARKALGGMQEFVDKARKVWKKAKKQGAKLRFKLKIEERTIHAKAKIEQAIDGLTQAQNDLDSNPKKGMGRDVKLTHRKFIAAELRFKNAEKLLAAETKSIVDAKKAWDEAQKLKGSDDEKDKEKMYQADIFLQACKIREEFAKEFKDKVYADYVDKDNNWLLDQNIAEFDKKTRLKQVALHKAYENPADFNVQEAEEAFAAERKKYISELNRKVSMKAKTIKKLKARISEIDTNQKLNPIDKDKQKALFEETLMREEKNLEQLEETTESKVNQVEASDKFDTAKKAPLKAGLPSDAAKLKDKLERSKQAINNAAKRICQYDKAAKKQVCGKAVVSEVAVAKQKQLYEDSLRDLKKAQNREVMNLKISIKLAKASNGELDDDDLDELNETKKREKVIAKEEKKVKLEKEKLKKKKLSKAAQEADTELAKEEKDDKTQDKKDKEDLDDMDDEDDGKSKKGKGKKGSGTKSGKKAKKVLTKKQKAELQAKNRLGNSKKAYSEAKIVHQEANAAMRKSVVAHIRAKKDLNAMIAAKKPVKDIDAARKDLKKAGEEVVAMKKEFSKSTKV